MNALDSPLEVFVAIDSLGLGLLTVVNNVWTWVAIITAAVSLWRIRSSPPPSSHHFPNSESPLVKPAAAERLPAASTKAKVESPRPSASAFNSEGRTSGKFTFYYVREEENDAAAANVDGDLDDVADGNEESKPEAVRNGWEVTMEMRMGDGLGLYRYQDLTVLDGNVVRLWEGCRRRGNVINGAASVVRCGGHEYEYEYDWSS